VTSTSANRQVRSARNALAEALGLGETYPLRDLPVTAEPPVAAYGSIARVAIEDSERTLAYRLLDQEARPLPRGAEPEGIGTGAAIAIDSPAIADDITFTVRATRPNGRVAMLVGTAQVRVGLDASLPVTLVPPGAVPTVIDHGATVEVEIAGSQEGVIYRLAGRPSPDPAAPDDASAMSADVPLSAPAGVAGTGGPIRIASVPLFDDTVVHVRASKVFGGSKPRPTQATLLQATLPIFVRPDAGLAVAAAPVIVDHGGQAAVEVAASQPGVAYTLHGRAIADAEFSRRDPPDPATVSVPTPDGDVRVVTPPPTPVWAAPPGYGPLADPVVGTGAALSLPVPPRLADTAIVVEARKSHAAGTDAFTSAERLHQPAVVLVRPDPSPPLRLAARVIKGKLAELSATGGEAGVFYAIAGPKRLGELYLHQNSPDDAALNKGIGALAVTVDLVVAAESPAQATSAAPPPVPRLELKPLALPAELAVTARRAMTGLTTALGKVAVTAPPAVEVKPAAVEPGKSATVTIAEPLAAERYAIMVDGKRVADPVPGAGAPLSLDTGRLAAGSRVELWIKADAPADAAIEIERLVPLDIAVG
jgi:hypothetical protein